MNPVLLFLIVLAMILLWFLLAFIFVPIGNSVWRLWDDAKKAMNYEEEKEMEKE